MDKEYKQYLLDNASECALFLKKNNDFPLDNPCEIACFGRGVRHTIKGGTGSGDVNCKFKTIEEALKEEGFEIISTPWLDGFDKEIEKKRKEFIESVRKEARKKHKLPLIYAIGKSLPGFDYTDSLDYNCDTAIYVLTRVCGEGCDRYDNPGDFRLTQSEINDIRYLNGKYQKFMLVLNTSVVIDLSDVKDVKNILLLSQLGEVTSETLAKILLGKANPSGKLTSTYAKKYPEIIDFGNMNDTYYNEGIYVGYRYFDLDNTNLLFPFGYGLSYSEFSFENTKVEKDNTLFKVFVDVKNVSEFKGKEVVEVYLSKPTKKLDNPIKELVAFSKTKALNGGESEIVEIKFDLKDFSSFDKTTSSYILESGDYYLLVGNSSDNVNVVSKIELDSDVCIKKVKSLNIDFDDFKANIERNYTYSGEYIFKLSKDDFIEEEISYELKTNINKNVLKLSDRELSYLTNGRYKEHFASPLGEASTLVSGAAGETTSKVKGYKPIALADGPAGLRLSPIFTYDRRGNVKPLGINNIINDILPFSGILKPIIKKMAYRKPKKKDKIYYQNTTAIPTATAISQSWNLDFAYNLGKIIAKEMEEYNVDIWLAPALNIKRSVFCGRNFEYYSEDPFISGVFSGSISRGVSDTNSKKYVTIKHYACNNQETNRYQSNSVVSERALRDIYLKGFEICIKMANPKAVMTSYNLLNGKHTSESYELVCDILRCEFGFRGIVMTDWLSYPKVKDKTLTHPHPDPVKIISSTTELIMPGDKKMAKAIFKRIKKDNNFKNVVISNVSRLIDYTDHLIK